MKKAFLFVLSCFMIATMSAQNIVEEHYTVSGGLLGAANFSKFRVTGSNHSNIEYERKTGWSAGAWVNFPLSTAFSIEPQVMYSVYRYRTSNATPLLLNDGKVNYISVPLLLKFHVGDNFAVTAGPQLDIVSSVDDEANTAREDDFNQTSFSAFGGLEVFPHGRVTIFGRYIHGFSNLDSRSTASDAMAFRNSNIQAGLKLKLFGKKVDADSDGDGVADKSDKCPNEFGVARYDGCPVPDSDRDGINDEEDKCPNQAGTAKYNGCPVPDSDGDGIDDENDRCPNQAGPASRNGCPMTDSDNDGIADDEDKCPSVAGVASNNGCPEISEKVTQSLNASAQNISFASGSSALTSRSHAALDRIVTMMNQNPTMEISIEAHTDNAGDEDRNKDLSKDRADAVKAYLVSKGIDEDRIETEGFGESQPIADNNTAAGRNRNRRIEIKIVN